MRGCGCIISVLLIPIAIVGLLIFVVLPSVMDIETIPGMSSVLQSALCEKGETISTERQTSSYRPGQTTYRATYSCTNNDAVKRNVTERATMVGLLAFVVPFLTGLCGGLFLIIGGSIGVARRATSTLIGAMPTDGFTMSDSSGVSGFGVTRQKESTTDRLQALKNAYDQGLITETEYENKRQDILSKM